MTRRQKGGPSDRSGIDQDCIVLAGFCAGVLSGANSSFCSHLSLAGASHSFQREHRIRPLTLGHCVPAISSLASCQLPRSDGQELRRPATDLGPLVRHAHPPRERMPQRYGTDEPVPRSYLAQLAYPFVRRDCIMPTDRDGDVRGSDWVSSCRFNLPSGDPALKRRSEQ